MDSHTAATSTIIADVLYHYQLARGIEVGSCLRRRDDGQEGANADAMTRKLAMSDWRLEWKCQG